MAIARPLQVPNKQRRWFAVLLGRAVSLPLWYLVRRRWRMCWTGVGEIADSGGGVVDGGNADLLVILNRLEQSSSEEAREAERSTKNSRG